MSKPNDSASLKKGLEDLIRHLEDAYRQSVVSEKAYNEMKSAGLKRLDEINNSRSGKKDGKR